jgi:hypothetical protein
VYNAVPNGVPAGVVASPPVVKGGSVAVGCIVIEECRISRYIEMKVLAQS